MVKIKIMSVGKTKESWLEEALQEYLSRLKPWALVDFVWAKNDEHLVHLLEREPRYLCLDAQGALFSSEEFATHIMQKMQDGGARLTLVIGGPEGLPSQIKRQSQSISLSRMTFTHQMARLILVEQIYRAFAIVNQLPYHK